MTMSKELSVKSPTSLAEKQEDTRPVRTFAPNVDIRETDEALWLWADMPGAAEDSIDVRLDSGQLSIRGKVSVDAYKELSPLYTEYNVGEFVRSFRVGNEVDVEQIEARMANGVLELKLPKQARARSRQIPIQTY
jgi:HSP20 family molecular chaperone IbpA